MSKRSGNTTTKSSQNLLSQEIQQISQRCLLQLLYGTPNNSLAVLQIWVTEISDDVVAGIVSLNVLVRRDEGARSTTVLVTTVRVLVLVKLSYHCLCFGICYGVRHDTSFCICSSVKVEVSVTVSVSTSIIRAMA